MSQGPTEECRGTGKMGLGPKVATPRDHDCSSSSPLGLGATSRVRRVTIFSAESVVGETSWPPAAA